MIIGLSGYAQSGKDTVAKFLVENHGYTRIAFADKIRELLYEMDPGIGMQGPDGQWHTIGLQNFVDVTGWDDAKQHKEVRAMLQNLGVGARKTFGENFWVHEAMKTMLNDPRPDLNYVITDVRFFNEADMVKANHGQIWRVERPGVDAVNNHVSETELASWNYDVTIVNDGTLERLNELVLKNLGLLV